MATLTVNAAPQRTPITLSSVAVAAANGGDKFKITGKELLYLESSDNAATQAVTFVRQQTIDGVVLSNLVITLPISGKQLLGPLSKTYFADTQGYCNLTYADYTKIKVYVVKGTV